MDSVVAEVVAAGSASDGPEIGGRVARFLDEPVSVLHMAVGAWDAFEPSAALSKRLDTLLASRERG